MKLLGLTPFQLGLLTILGIGVSSLFTPYPEKLARVMLNRETPQTPKEKEKTAPAKPQPIPIQQAEEPATWSPTASFKMADINLPPFPPVLPERIEIGRFEHVSSMARGINISNNVNFTQGGTATEDRKKREAYQLDISLNLFSPKAATGENLLAANPELKKVLPAYDVLMQNAHVSTWFNAIYQHKQNRVRKNTATLSRLLDRHNYYDTDTVLEITAPDTARKALWVQADMDVVSDGSDGDRLADMPEQIKQGVTYQYSTSYFWKKKTNKPNPLLPAWEAKLKRHEAEKDKKSIESTKKVIADLKLFSYLLAEYDPFIVIPLTFKNGNTDNNKAYRPEPGDYAVVIVDNRVFPAIVGDYGPKFKTGEASLRLCKAVNNKASIHSRAVSDLGVSYIIFPGTKEPTKGPIDYARLNTRCRELLNEMGGIGQEAQFIEMEDLLPQPKPEQKTTESQKQ